MSVRMTEEEYAAATKRSTKAPAAPKAKPSKFRNVPTTVNGERFDSKGEAQRYAALLAAEQTGAISNLRHEVAYALTVSGELIGKYIADYVYYVGGVRVVEDFKSPASRTPFYLWKRKHLLAEHGIVILETDRNT